MVALPALPAAIGPRGMENIPESAHGSDLGLIAALACRLEPSSALLAEWLNNTPIPRLDNRTVIELIHLGQGERVVDLLRSALQHEARQVSDIRPGRKPGKTLALVAE